MPEPSGGGRPPVRTYVPLMLLAATSGAFDAIGVLGLGGVFASVMTGNLVLLGLGAGAHRGALAAHASVAITGYVVGVTVGIRTAGDRPQVRAEGWTRRVRLVLAVEAVLVVGFSVGWELAHGRPTPSAQLALVGVAATAMGLQSAAMRLATGTSTSTTYLTGTLTGVVAAVAGRRPLRGEWEGVAILVAAFGGAALAGVTLLGRPTLAPLVPVVALAGGVASVAGAEPRRVGRASG